LAVVVFADWPCSFEEAAALAEAQEQAVSTKEYFAGVLLPYYPEKYGPVLQSCFAKVPKPSNPSFAFVVAVGADGRVIRLYNNRETNIFLCIRGVLEREVFPTPPVVPYYLHIEMKFTDEDLSERRHQDTAPHPLY
jgi:hypothetical protein